MSYTLVGSDRSAIEAGFVGIKVIAHCDLCASKIFNINDYFMSEGVTPKTFFHKDCFDYLSDRQKSLNDILKNCWNKEEESK